MGSVYNRGTRDKPVYYGKYKEAGAWRTIKTGQSTKEQARRYVEAIEARIKRGLVGIEEPTAEDVARDRMTVRDLVEKFATEYTSVKVKDLTLYRRMTGGLLRKHVVPTLGSTRVADLKPGSVETLRDKLRETLTASTVRSILVYLSRAYNWAAKRDVIDCPNPVHLVDKPTIQDQGFDYLSADEVARLLEWSADHQPSEHAFYATAVYAGLRRGELTGLRWCDVALDRKQITVARSYRGATKSSKRRHVPVNPRLLTILRAWRERCPASEEGLAFPTAEGRMRSRTHGMDADDEAGYKHALAASGCHAVDLHSLRHTFASHAIMSGMNILTLQRLMGHSTVAVTMRYSHLAPDFEAAEVARMSFEPKVAGVSSMADHRAAQPA